MTASALRAFTRNKRSELRHFGIRAFHVLLQQPRFIIRDIHTHWPTTEYINDSAMSTEFKVLTRFEIF